MIYMSHPEGRETKISAEKKGWQCRSSGTGSGGTGDTGRVERGE